MKGESVGDRKKLNEWERKNIPEEKRGWEVAQKWNNEQWTNTGVQRKKGRKGGWKKEKERKKRLLNRITMNRNSEKMLLKNAC